MNSSPITAHLFRLYWRKPEEDVHVAPHQKSIWEGCSGDTTFCCKDIGTCGERGRNLHLEIDLYELFTKLCSLASCLCS